MFQDLENRHTRKPSSRINSIYKINWATLFYREINIPTPQLIIYSITILTPWKDNSVRMDFSIFSMEKTCQSNRTQDTHPSGSSELFLYRRILCSTGLLVFQLSRMEKLSSITLILKRFLLFPLNCTQFIPSRRSHNVLIRCWSTVGYMFRLPSSSQHSLRCFQARSIPDGQRSDNAQKLHSCGFCRHSGNELRDTKETATSLPFPDVSVPASAHEELHKFGLFYIVTKKVAADFSNKQASANQVFGLTLGRKPSFQIAKMTL